MAFLTIDETRCKQDGICAAECPRQLIIQEDDKSFPRIPPANEASCMACGHCVAVCPHGALSVAGVDIKVCPEINNDLVLSQDQADQFLRSRRSIRCFKDKIMDRGTLEKLIHTARYAPTASNAQNLHWTVIEGRDQLKPLSQATISWMERVIEAQPDSPAADYFRPVVAGWAAGYDGILRTAQTLIVPSAPKENANGLVDLSITLSYLELAALPLGVGNLLGRIAACGHAGHPRTGGNHGATRRTHLVLSDDDRISQVQVLSIAGAESAGDSLEIESR